MSESKTTIIILYDGLNLLTLDGATGAGGKTRARVTLKPGKNVVQLSDWHIVKDAKLGSSVLPLLIDQGKIKEMAPQTPTDAKSSATVDPENITSYNAKDAISLIQNTFEVEGLDVFQSQEIVAGNRTTVLDAITKQREKITVPVDENTGGS